MYLIVGLGNPGAKYRFTRHNVGFLTIDYLCDDLKVECSRIGFFAKRTSVNYGGEKLILAKPQTYMNDSGRSVRALMDYYGIGADGLIVIYDDVDLPVGKMRIKAKGSSGHHNGMKSVIAHVGTEEFVRIRMGIGTPANDIIDHVLGTMTDEELKTIPFEKGAKAALTIIEKGVAAAQSECN
ncbi:MAG: aminoacyl-tRNA hydrolase [Clostridia bacterium]|nr:aminoacyl-tRNA hydrolase [Clostridia bacterium]